jgi:hypothetical protein
VRHQQDAAHLPAQVLHHRMRKGEPTFSPREPRIVR